MIWFIQHQELEEVGSSTEGEGSVAYEPKDDLEVVSPKAKKQQ